MQENKLTCMMCKFAKTGECFPQKNICSDFVRAYELNKSQKQIWGFYGDNSTQNRLDFEKLATNPDDK